MFKNDTKLGYSLALLDIAKEEKKINSFYEQSNAILSNLEDQPQFEQILDSNNLDTKTKSTIISTTFKGMHWALINTMTMLALKNQFKHFREILKNLIKHLQEILGIQQGIVYSTKWLSKEEIKKLESKLQNKYNKKITLKNLIDNELIGGFKIKLGSIVIEDSVKLELELIEKSLLTKRGGE